LKPLLAFQACTGHESLLLEKTPLAKSLTGGSSPSKYLIHVENASTAYGVNSVSSIQDNVIVNDDGDFEKYQVDYVELESDFRSGSKFFYSLAYNSIKEMENVSFEGANKTPGGDINVGKSAAAEDGSQAKSCPPVKDVSHLDTSKHSFETQTGPAGRPGTRPTWAWDRSGSKQKPAWELA